MRVKHTCSQNIYLHTIHLFNLQCSLKSKTPVYLIYFKKMDLDILITISIFGAYYFIECIFAVSN